MLCMGCIQSFSALQHCMSACPGLRVRVAPLLWLAGPFWSALHVVEMQSASSLTGSFVSAPGVLERYCSQHGMGCRGRRFWPRWTTWPATCQATSPWVWLRGPCLATRGLNTWQLHGPSPLPAGECMSSSLQARRVHHLSFSPRTLSDQCSFTYVDAWALRNCAV